MKENPMRTRIIVHSVSSVLVVLVCVTVLLADEQTAAQAFEQYEAVQVALAGDQMKNVAKPAAALVPLADALAGKEGRDAAERLAKAADLAEARDAFATLSRLLVPKFQAAGLPGVHAFECSMVQEIWAQRGDRPQNPYMGQAMATCGTRIDSRK
jgi:hypothetical protein